MQIIVALGDRTGLGALLRRQECDPSARAAGTPALAELAAVHGPPLLRLCRAVRLRWAPARHRLFHPAHRSTVLCVLLVARCGPSRGLAGLLIRQIPTEVWFAIIEQLGQAGWPNRGREALLL